MHPILFLICIPFDQFFLLFGFFFCFLFLLFRRFFSLLSRFFLRFFLCLFFGFLFRGNLFRSFPVPSSLQPAMSTVENSINNAISTTVSLASFCFCFTAISLSGSAANPAVTLNIKRSAIKRKSYSASVSLWNNSLPAYHSLIVTTVPTFTNFLISSISLFRTRILPAEEALPSPSGLFVPEMPIPFHSPLLSSRVSRVMNQGP